MHRLALCLATALVSTLAVAAPAQAATYSVSMYYSAPKADVGQTLTISGVVAGGSARYKTLTVQRRVGSGGWATVGTTTTSGNGRYGFAHKVSAVGAQQFRVVAPRSGSAAQGVSVPKGFTGWTWLTLTRQPATMLGGVNWDIAPTVAGAVRKNSALLFGSGALVFWMLDNKCDQSSVHLGTYDSASGSVGATVATEDGSATYALTAATLTPANLVTTQTAVLQIERTASNVVFVVSPRVHCSVATLKEPAY